MKMKGVERSTCFVRQVVFQYIIFHCTTREAVVCKPEANKHVSPKTSWIADFMRILVTSLHNA